MIKTVKTKKQMRLDELIKYIWDNNIKAEQELVEYKSNTRTIVTVDMSGQIAVYGAHFGNEVFTVEVEEEITEDTEFEAFVVITDKRVIKSINNYHNMRAVRGLLENYEVEQKIYALIDNNLELIWEAE